MGALSKVIRHSWIPLAMLSTHMGLTLAFGEVFIISKEHLGMNFNLITILKVATKYVLRDLV